MKERRRNRCKRRHWRYCIGAQRTKSAEQRSGGTQYPPCLPSGRSNRSEHQGAILSSFRHAGSVERSPRCPESRSCFRCPCRNCPSRLQWSLLALALPLLFADERRLKYRTIRSQWRFAIDSFSLPPTRRMARLLSANVRSTGANSAH